jgi:hypothetical protein
LETVLVLVQDRCTVCTERTIGSGIVLDAPEVHLGDEAHVDAHFGLFGDSANLDAREMHGLHQTYHRLGIVLHMPDGTSKSLGSSQISFQSIWRWC